MPRASSGGPNIVAFGGYTRCSPKIEANPIFCTILINPYMPRPLIGVHGDQMHEIVLYMAGKNAKISGLHGKGRMLKRDKV